MTLRARLTLAVVGLLAVAVAAVGLVAVVATRQVLTDQVDELLRATQVRQGAPLPRDLVRRIPPVEAGGAGPFGDDERYEPVARLLVDVDGTVERAQPAGFADDPLPVPATVDVAALDDQIATVEVDGTSYRATAQPIGERGDGGEVGAWLVLLAPLTEVDDTVGGLLWVVVLAGAGALAVGGGLSWWLIGRNLAPVDRMVDTASAIAAGDLSQRVEHGDDGTELGRLATALDDMLAQLESAFAERAASEQRLRRFVADASHELRTPLAAVRGYAELYRAGGLPDDEALDRAMGRIEGESARMAALVEDLLTLARLDQAQPLAAEPVDLTALVGDVVDDARVVDPGHPMSPVVEDGVVVVGDERRLRQVASNLCTNARVHTPPGTTVSVTLARDGDDAVLRVADDGPGMAPEVRDRAFERFVRGDESRARATGGTGLGLSIVDAVVAAHGGRVDLDSEPGRGTTVTVRLPVGGPVADSAPPAADVGPLGSAPPPDLAP